MPSYVSSMCMCGGGRGYLYYPWNHPAKKSMSLFFMVLLNFPGRDWTYRILSDALTWLLEKKLTLFCSENSMPNL